MKKLIGWSLILINLAIFMIVGYYQSGMEFLKVIGIVLGISAMWISLMFGIGMIND